MKWHLGRLSVVRSLLERGANIEAIDEYNSTALSLSAQKGNWKN